MTSGDAGRPQATTTAAPVTLARALVVLPLDVGLVSARALALRCCCVATDTSLGLLV